MEVEKVNLKMVVDNDGIEQWAYTGIGTSSPRSLRNNLRHEIQQAENREQQSIYKLLLVEM